MRPISGILLSILFSLPWLMQLAITVDFGIHQDFIAQNLCENRDKPELHCDGKCVLMQKLNMIEDSESPKENAPEIPALEILHFMVPSRGENLRVEVRKTVERYLAINERVPKNAHLADIFHPPQLLG